MRAELDKRGKLEVHTDSYDLCYSCKNVYKCPLVHAISQEIVILHYSNIEIKDCGLFKK